MPAKILKAAIVGPSSLLGKELAEQLNASAAVLWDIALLEAEGESGQITSVGDEALIVLSIEAGSFNGMDVVFFAGDADSTREHWKAAVAAGASVVDLTGALQDQPGVAVTSPLVKSAGGDSPVDLTTLGVVSAHPAAVMLGAVLTRLRERFGSVRAAATVMEPASQQGSAGLDEMHGQTVGLLSFQSLPKEVFDAQVAFNLSSTLGEAAKTSLATIATLVRDHLRRIAGEDVAQNCALQLLQAPVFNGYTASVYVVLDQQTGIAEVERALVAGVITVPGPDDAPPSNQAATEQDQILVQVRADNNGATSGAGFWLWIAADNLRLAARNAIACALELLALKPGGRVQ